MSSPWCSPGFRPTERICRATRLHKPKENEIIRIISFWKARFHAEGQSISDQGLGALGLGCVCRFDRVDLALFANVISVKSWRWNPCLVENVFTKQNLKWGFGSCPVDGITLGIKLDYFLSRIVLFVNLQLSIRLSNFHTLLFVHVDSTETSWGSSMSQLTSWSL